MHMFIVELSFAQDHFPEYVKRPRDRVVVWLFFFFCLLFFLSFFFLSVFFSEVKKEKKKVQCVEMNLDQVPKILMCVQ